jgi:ubiquinone biosynthesis protein UbiJ
MASYKMVNGERVLMKVAEEQSIRRHQRDRIQDPIMDFIKEIKDLKRKLAELEARLDGR